MEKSCTETRFPQVSDTIRAWLIIFRLTALSLLVWAPVYNRETLCTVHVRSRAEWPNGRTAKYGIIGISLLVENRIKSKKECKDHISSKISKGERKERKKEKKMKTKKKKEDEIRRFGKNSRCLTLLSFKHFHLQFVEVSSPPKQPDRQKARTDSYCMGIGSFSEGTAAGA